MALSGSAPFNDMSVMARAQTLPDEQGDSSHTPYFYMCSQTPPRMKADILMLSKECDYRLFVKTRKKLTDCFIPFVINSVTECTLTDGTSITIVILLPVAILECIMFNSSCNKISRHNIQV